MMHRILKNILWPVNFRGKARLLLSVCPREGQFDTKIAGFITNVDLSDFGQRCIYLNIFEPEETRLIRKFLKQGMTFVDVGANIGYYTLLASSIVGATGKVIAFEPSPYAYGKLKQSIERNELLQVDAYQLGISDFSGVIELYMPKWKGNHAPSMIANDGGFPVPVNVVRLDQFLEEKCISFVDMLKIDVEGLEPNVINSAKGYLNTGKIRAILCEFNQYWLEKNKSSSESLYQVLFDYGFRSVGRKPDFTIGLQNLLMVKQSVI